MITQVIVFSGGTYAEPGAPTCTHLVVDEHSVKTIPFDRHSRLHVVKSEVSYLSDFAATERCFIVLTVILFEKLFLSRFLLKYSLV